MKKSNKFNLSHEVKYSCNMGELIPCGLTEVLPGDSWQHRTSALIRVSPLVSPVMHPVHVSIKHFFVPYRLIWDNFEKFITGGPDGNDATVHPYIDAPSEGGWTVGSLMDYLGVTPGVNSLRSNALFARAYSLIWNDWYRDEQLQTELVISKGDGADTTTNTSLQNVCWEKDYFTSSRPEPQLGDPVTLSLAGSAPVKGIGARNGISADTTDQSVWENNGDGTASNVTYGQTWTPEGNEFFLDATTTGAPGINNPPNIRAELSDVSAFTIDDLRQASALQIFKERNNRYGDRYVEFLMHEFGVRSPDARQQRPELLGQGTQVIQFSEVLSTANTEVDSVETPVGAMKGHGIAAMSSNKYGKFFTEHGVVISLMHCRPKTVYMQGMFRMHNRTTRFDYFQPTLQHIGQQAILNKEVDATHATPNGTFGWQDKYDEYRRSESRVAAEFRTVYDSYHYARDFSTDPALNSDFVECVPTDRVYADTNTDQLLVMLYHRIIARRRISKRGSSFLR